MNIGLYIRNFPAEDDYMRDYTNVAFGLAAKGHRVRVLTDRGTSGDVEGIQVTTGPAGPTGIRQARHWLHDQHPAPDVIMAVEWWNTLTHVLTKDALVSGIPVLLAPWASLNPYAIARDWRALPKRIAIKAATVFYGRLKPCLQCFDSVDIQHARDLGLDWPCLLAPLGIYDDYPTSPPGFDWSTHLGTDCSKTRTLFFNARLDVWQKGYDLLLAGFRQAMQQADEDFRTILVLSGKPPPERNLRGKADLAQRLAQTLSPSNHVFWKGFLPADDRSAMMSNCDMFAYPSRVDGPPRPVRESLWRGTPVMVTRETGFGDWVRKHQAGIVVKQISVNAVAKAVLELNASSTARIAAMRQGARDCAQRLSWRRCIDDYEAMLSQTIANGVSGV